ncbi:MAG: neurogenic locus notch [Legionella sp.]
MRSLNLLLFATVLSLHLPASLVFSADTHCCKNMGGINYCDKSANRLVCNSGDYSSCYCSPHAVMDLQEINGCCLWQGGIMATDSSGMVICNNGGISELCTLTSSR